MRLEHCTEHDMSDMPRRGLLAAKVFLDANKCHGGEGGTSFLPDTSRSDSVSPHIWDDLLAIEVTEQAMTCS